VVLEHFLTDTADCADYVLPATTQLEHWDVHTSYGHTYVLINHPAMPPLGQARPTPRSSAPGRAHGLTRPCFQDSDETLARQALPSRWTSTSSAPGWVKLPLPDAAVCRRRLPHAQRQGQVDAPGLGVPDYVPNHE
jgi:hypothetical protein